MSLSSLQFHPVLSFLFYFLCVLSLSPQFHLILIDGSTSIVSNSVSHQSLLSRSSCGCLAIFWDSEN
ncbi:hypothetical protein RchiOBHm_Chr6g0251651 [Rosa chinensis]|uniref:Uncharacterized protein n=1 Tax=Rosa chinensis TaxID=74649 RepID=A0A2P6PKX8_ROSCH|nr:hypothetical protein RchiOBHm_Chr6g0251651 [Rosa chinensis]